MSKYTEWLARTGGPRVSGLSNNRFTGDLVHLQITYGPLKDAEHTPPAEIADELASLTVQGKSDPVGIVPRVEALLERYPDECHLLNKLAAGLAADGQNERAKEVAELNYRKNPNYLFGRLNYAEFLLVGGQYDKVLDLFGGTFNLRAMYPHRTVFHATEVAGLFSLMTRYFMFTENVPAALNAASNLKQVDPNHPTVMYVERAEAQLASELQKKGLSRMQPGSRKAHAGKQQPGKDHRGRKRH
jgi:tetratricopeptide (TPR) repeat protein